MREGGGDRQLLFVAGKEEEPWQTTMKEEVECDLDGEMLASARWSVQEGEVTGGVQRTMMGRASSSSAAAVGNRTTVLAGGTVKEGDGM